MRSLHHANPNAMTPKRYCDNGPGCLFLVTGNCWYEHPQAHYDEMDRKRKDRVAEMESGLKQLEELDMQAVLAQGGQGGQVGIAQVRELASFNKVADGVIAVPGLPPRFTPLTSTLEIPNDCDNTTLPRRYPQYTHHFEPLLRAVEAMPRTVANSSELSVSKNSPMPSGENMLKTADIISNANNLRRLFHHVCNTTYASDRFEAEMHGTTLLLSRWNDDPDLLISYGRGVGFERATCRYTDDVDDVIRKSASHHRVCSYDLGGLHMVVQSEVDAYFCGCDHQIQTARQIDEIPSVTSSSATPEPDVPKHTVTRTRTRTRTRTDPLPVPHKKGSTAPSRQRQRLPSFTALTLDDPGDAPSFTPAPTPLHRVTRPSSTITVHHVPGPGSASSSSSSLTAGTHGSALPTAKCLVEIKTHNGRTPQRSTAEEQLYFACRSQLYSMSHEDGVFSPPSSLREAPSSSVSQSSGRRLSTSSFGSSTAFGSSPPKPGRYTPPHLRSPSSSPPKSWSSYGRRNTISSWSTLSTSPSSIATSPPPSPSSAFSSPDTSPHPGLQDMTHLMHRFESENKERLRDLVTLLRTIKEKVMTVSDEYQGRVRVSLVFESDGSREPKGVSFKVFQDAGGAKLWP